jgi:lacY proton/sugar symporter
MGLQKKIRVDTSIKKKNAKLNIKYAILQMMFWTCAASAYAYLTQMLQYKGFTDGQIGVINAVKLFSTVVFQIIIGVFSDRHAERIQLKYIISVLTVVALLLTSVFYEYKLSFVQTVTLFIGFGATFTCISPLIDSMSIKYMNGGRNINYPICRALGARERISAANITETRKTEVHTAGYLLTTYPKYRWFLIGSAVMFMGYNVGTTFLINVFERLGGNNFHYGLAEFVMAVSEVPSAFLLIKFRKRISLDKIMLCCAVFMTFKNMFAAFSDNVWVIVISQGCEMLGFGLFYSGSVYLIEEMLSPADVVKGMSLINAFTVGAGEGIGALLCGWINSRYGLTVLMDSSVVISAVSIVCIVIMCRASNEIHGKIIKNS